jgi:hypothetical protein
VSPRDISRGQVDLLAVTTADIGNGHNPPLTRLSEIIPQAPLAARRGLDGPWKPGRYCPVVHARTRQKPDARGP